MSTERLQKILARAGVESRRKAEDLIAAGQVTVNGTTATIGDSADPVHDAIKVDGKRIWPRLHNTYLLLNKPIGVMTTRDDPEGRKTIVDLLPPKLKGSVFPVGRLDFRTEGLLVLTDDGDFAQKIAHPSSGCSKTYQVKVKGAPSKEQIDRLRRGVVIDGRRTLPTKIVSLRRPGPRTGTNTWWTVVLNEGRTRQIREMFFRIGHPVQRLRRIAIGPLRDPRLRPGDLRELTAAEVEMLREADARKPKKRKPAKRTPKAGGAAGAGKSGKTSKPGARSSRSKTPSRGGPGGGGRSSGGKPSRSRPKSSGGRGPNPRTGKGGGAPGPKGPKGPKGRRSGR